MTRKFLNTTATRRGGHAALLLWCLIIAVAGSSVQATYHQSKRNKKPKKVPYLGKKGFEKAFRLIAESVYAHPDEVTNIDYIRFIEALKQQGESVVAYQMDSTQWTSTFPHAVMEPMAQHYGWHPAFYDYPAVNIPHAGAVRYCQWLTEQYHTMPKRKYKKVVFRLPTAQEWLQAAAPLPDHNLPWYGSKWYNANNQIMANVKATDFADPNHGSVYYHDGYFYTTKTVYQANSNGLYHIIGNVAEMLQQAGQAKGGHGDSFIQNCGVEQTQTYTGPDPRVGFRVFMEVLEP